ncbi:ABC transporter ATP-binding protein [Acidisphaera sp. S103]|uniref:ABC transporter ATP-binding protein n=1 Tax=Acidisphaera sp. S103 TaxID=1747223 RepID=UPI00131B1C04|nr:ABC transporter ATP-binding protein [Acidisphaera sp. S103]
MDGTVRSIGRDTASAIRPFLELEAVSRRFGGVQAVDGVDLAIARGELLGIIGPNGAGKTTLFNLISGFVRPSSGRIRFKGRRIDGKAAHRIAHFGISRTFQNLRVFPNLTVFDNVAAGAIGALGFPAWRAFIGGNRTTAITQRTWQALERVGLAGHATDAVTTLPYGRRKYLEIARALATEPELLILDEPAAGLNETETIELADFMRGLNASGLTLLLVEHDMGLVMSTCRRVVVLAAGRKIADAAPAEVQADPEVQRAYLGGAE